MSDPGNGTYSRRRIDELMDDRFDRIELRQDGTSRKIDRLEARLNYLFGALAVLSVVGNFLVPLIVRWITGGTP